MDEKIKDNIRHTTRTFFFNLHFDYNSVALEQKGFLICVTNLIIKSTFKKNLKTCRYKQINKRCL